MKRPVFTPFVFAALFFAADSFGVSAHRPPLTDYLMLAKQYRPKRLKPSPQMRPLTSSSSVSAYDGAVKFSDLDISIAAMEKDYEKLFEYVRDNRELTDPSKTAFARRISWLYPYDGCWIRAAIASQWAEREKFARPHKLFIFGNLNVSTPNATDGDVSWWFHVVAAIRDAAGDLFVIDPAIDPSGPMKAKEWILKMVSVVDDAKLNLCSPHTYEPYDDCDATSSASDAGAVSDMPYYLKAERSNLVDLGRDADKELGDSPPWALHHE